MRCGKGGASACSALALLLLARGLALERPSSCRALEVAYSRNSDGSTRAERWVSVYGHTRTLEVAHDGRAPSRAAAALLAAGLRARLRCQRVHLAPPSHGVTSDMCGLAYRMQDRCEDMDFIDDLYNSLWFEACLKAKEVPPRMQVLGTGAAPTQLRLHVHLAAAADAPKAVQAFLDLYGWTRLALLSDSTELARDLYEAFQCDHKFKVYNTLVSSNVSDTLQSLQSLNARIFFVNTSPDMAQIILCAAHRLGMTSSAEYVWILREWRAVDLHCEETVSYKPNISHFTISFWWRGGNHTQIAPLIDDDENILRSTLDKLWPGYTWPPLAAPLADSLALLIKSFKKFVELYPEKYFDLHGSGSARFAYHVSAPSLTRLATEAASALAYLALQRLVHRDVRARNCLVDARRSLKLADFRLARKTGLGAAGEEEYLTRRRGLFPVLWMAPESLERGVFTAASDAWGLGVLLLELVTLGARPYGAWPPLRVLQYVSAGGIPPLPPDVSEST
ncbi:hypothetical protein ABMA28_013921 [Loxostege sticticalis]|uniref:Protein kinase domain-containing protein n=1 Tax=Loxostege sticticalis TaxID=481309 RepID=A0ABD0TK97_LOXSC